MSEKIDGTNGVIYITEDGEHLYAGSRSRWITPEQDNFGFARWVRDNRDELMKLGPGKHYGEWWGCGIGRRYGVPDKRFSLFNTFRWAEAETRPACCGIVPVLAVCEFTTENILHTMAQLQESGSIAAPGFMKPEGVVIYHHHVRVYMKKTFEKDSAGKEYGG